VSAARPPGGVPDGTLIRLRDDMQGRRPALGPWAWLAVILSLAGAAAWIWLGSAALSQILRPVGVVIRVMLGAR